MKTRTDLTLFSFLFLLCAPVLICVVPSLSNPGTDSMHIFFSAREMATIKASGKDIMNVYPAGKIPSNVVLPEEIRQREFGFFTVIKGMIRTSKPMKDILNLFLAFGQMKGIRYYSVTEKKEKILIKDCYTVSDSVDLKPLPDRAVDSLPEFLRVFCLQTDNRGGGMVWDNVFRMCADGSLVYVRRNARPYRRLIFFKIEKHAIYRYMRLFPTDEGFLVFVVSGFRPPPFTPAKMTRPESFKNRAKAFLGHYRRKLAEDEETNQNE